MKISLIALLFCAITAFVPANKKKRVVFLATLLQLLVQNPVVIF